MWEERSILIEGKSYPVVLSDQKEVLLAAQAAGKAFVGVLTEEGDRDLSPARYLVEDVADADHRFLEQVVRRSQGLPWVIGESDRIVVREFLPEDADQMLPEPEDTDGDRIFQSRELLEAYIRSQYGFFQYGMWAIVRKSDGKILGKAGISCGGSMDGEEGEDAQEALAPCGKDQLLMERGRTHGDEIPMELGYHLAAPYRGCGYAREACRIILQYIEEVYQSPVCARVQPDNVASVRLLEDLGFRAAACPPGDSGTALGKFQYPPTQYWIQTRSSPRIYNSSDNP